MFYIISSAVFWCKGTVLPMKGKHQKYLSGYIRFVFIFSLKILLFIEGDCNSKLKYTFHIHLNNIAKDKDVFFSGYSNEMQKMPQQISNSGEQLAQCSRRSENFVVFFFSVKLILSRYEENDVTARCSMNIDRLKRRIFFLVFYRRFR